eukprot:1390467-Pleurochrysis_carterae.AAC.4
MASILSRAAVLALAGRRGAQRPAPRRSAAALPSSFLFPTPPTHSRDICSHGYSVLVSPFILQASCGRARALLLAYARTTVGTALRALALHGPLCRTLYGFSSLEVLRDVFFISCSAALARAHARAQPFVVALCASTGGAAIKGEEAPARRRRRAVFGDKGDADADDGDDDDDDDDDRDGDGDGGDSESDGESEGESEGEGKDESEGVAEEEDDEGEGEEVVFQLRNRSRSGARKGGEEAEEEAAETDAGEASSDSGDGDGSGDDDGDADADGDADEVEAGAEWKATLHQRAADAFRQVCASRSRDARLAAEMGLRLLRSQLRVSVSLPDKFALFVVTFEQLRTFHRPRISRLLSKLFHCLSLALSFFLASPSSAPKTVYDLSP